MQVAVLVFSFAGFTALSLLKQQIACEKLSSNVVDTKCQLHCCRYGGLSGSDSFKRKWHKLVLCIEGPDEPPNMDAFLEPLAAALERLGPPKPGAEQLNADVAGNQLGGK